MTRFDYKDMNAKLITYLEPLVHENVFVKKLCEFVSSASVPGVEVSPKELCALLHQGWQHVLFGCIANVTHKLEGTQVEVVSVNVPEKQDGMNKDSINFFNASSVRENGHRLHLDLFFKALVSCSPLY